MPAYKLQVQDDDSRPQQWRDVLNDAGLPMLFEKEGEARAALEQMFPLLVKLERFAAGPKRARVVIVNPYQDIDEEKED